MHMLIKYLKRKVLREHAKLVFQNLEAAGFLAATAAGPNLVMMESELVSFARSWMYRMPLNIEQASKMIEINREPRRLYDCTASSQIENFDLQFAPPLGWKEFYRQMGA